MDSTARLWRVSAGAAATPILALGLLVVVLATAEVMARSAIVRGSLPAPSIGSPSRLLEVQRAGLAAQSEAEGGVDCVFLGNSLVLFGVDPAAFASEFAARTGTPVRCFNFAVSALSVSQVAPIARILAEDYRPRWLIYGLTKRDFNAGDDGPAIESIPWIRYRLGEPSLDGWLAQHSLLYGYSLMAATRDGVTGGADDFTGRLRRGFFPVAPASILREADVERARVLLLHQVELPESEERMRALEELFELRSSGVRIVLLEMPVHLAPTQWPPAATIAYAAVIDRVKRRAAAEGVPFWTSPPELIPSDGWFDLWHLNTKGAEAFSRWLGERAASAVQHGEIPSLGSAGSPPPA
jgi:hypothetical protein